LPQPTLIAAKGKDWFSVENWRNSPQQMPTILSPELTPSPSPKPAGSPNLEGVKPRRRRRRGKASIEEDSTSFIVRCAIGGATGCQTEQVLSHLQSCGIAPTEHFTVPSPRPILAKRTESGDDVASSPIPTGLSNPEVEISPLIASSGASPVVEAGTGGELPPMMPEIALPPSLSASLLETHALLYLILVDAAVSDACVSVLTSQYPYTAVEKVLRKSDQRNATLVIKNLPFSLRPERLHDELQKLQFPPSYMRLLRNDRGIFKSVVFVKFPTRDVAEKSKLEMERFLVAGKPLKVEFKKRCKDPAAATEPTSTEPPAEKTPQTKPQEAAKLKREEQSPAMCAALEQLVREIKGSKDVEGFSYQRSALTREEQRFLRQICATQNVLFDQTTELITVRRKAVPLEHKEPRRSPGMRPATTTPTMGSSPPPLPLPPPEQPMNDSFTGTGSFSSLTGASAFKGIKHWKESRNSTTPGNRTLPIHRCLGPLDLPPFAAGRGCPPK
jgi:hypothetical protein